MYTSTASKVSYSYSGSNLEITVGNPRCQSTYSLVTAEPEKAQIEVTRYQGKAFVQGETE